MLCSASPRVVRKNGNSVHGIHAIDGWTDVICSAFLLRALIENGCQSFIDTCTNPLCCLACFTLTIDFVGVSLWWYINAMIVVLMLMFQVHVVAPAKLLGDCLIHFVLSNVMTKFFGGHWGLWSVVKGFNPGVEQLSDLGDTNRMQELQWDSCRWNIEERRVGWVHLRVWCSMRYANFWRSKSSWTSSG